MAHLALTVWKHPLNVYLAQRNVKAFNEHSWEESPRKEKLKLWQDLLHGLCAIHQRGWMHSVFLSPPRPNFHFSRDPTYVLPWLVKFW